MVIKVSQCVCSKPYLLITQKTWCNAAYVQSFLDKQDLLHMCSICDPHVCPTQEENAGLPMHALQTKGHHKTTILWGNCSLCSSWSDNVRYEWAETFGLQHVLHASTHNGTKCPCQLLE